MRDRSSLGAAGLVVAALALASLAAQPRSSTAPEAPVATVPATARHAPAPMRAAHVEVLRDGGRLDLNLATAGDLELLPGIGPALARRIVEDRTHGGAYRSVDELVRVSGIGPSKLARIRALVAVAADSNPTQPLGAQRSYRNTVDSTAVR